MDLDALIAQAKDAVGQIIQKPKMTEKLLAKPPFRFLHDTITAISTATGFADGLYSETELDSAQISDKDAKIAYLQKIFNLVGICKGEALSVSALKVVAGAEPENTNLFLISLAQVATDGSIDSAEAVKRSLAGEEPGSRAAPRKKTGGSAIAESKSDEQPSSSAKSERASAKEIDSSGQSASDSDRGRSRSGTRGGKPSAQSSGDTGLSRTAVAPNLDKEIEKCDGSEATTQSLLGELITRPKLTEKLLSKPPFRFLFDIVMEVTKVTGFARYLYSEDEMSSANITEKAQKLNFLEKIIKLVGLQLNTIVVAQPLKIIAGQDAENTNIFLQQLAIAAKYVPDSMNVVKTVIDEFGGGNPQDLATALMNATTSTVSSKEDRKRQSIKPAPAEQKDEMFTPPAKNDFPMSNDDKLGDADADADTKRSARPTTARRRPPKVKDAANEINNKDSIAVKKTEGILLDGQGDEDDDDLVTDDKRLADDFKSSGNSNINQANVKSKLVKDILSLQAEQEAATKASNENNAEDKASDADKAAGGIRLRGGIRKTGTDKKGGAITSNTVTSNFGESDIERIRSAVQILVQQTGPLGSCMDFIQEDVGLMTTELHKWEDECRRDEAVLATEKLKTKEMLQPFQSELSELEDQIKDQLAKITSLKASIARNDESIQKVLKLVATA